jgi:hypothetical protein
MARPKLTPEEREKRRIKRKLTRNFFMEALRREDAITKSNIYYRDGR